MTRRRLDGSSNRVTIDALQHSWRAGRNVAGPPIGAAELGRLRQEFGRQMVRLKTLCADPRWHRPGCRPLVNAALSHSRLSRFLFDVFEEIAARPEGESRQDELVVVEQLMAFHREAVEKLEAQSQALDFLKQRVAQLRPLSDELQGSPVPKADGWRRLIAEIASDAAQTASAADVLPLAGFCMAEAGSANDASTAKAFGRGLSTARLLGRILIDRDVERGEMERVLLAAILQDAGLLLLERHGDRARLYDHAALGAALVGGLSGISSEIPALVAGHHRRLTDSGPRASDSPTSRLLSTAIRLIELIEAAEIDDEWDAAPQRQCAVLVREAADGYWDADATLAIVQSVGYPLEENELRRLDTRSTMRRLMGGRFRLDARRRSPIPRPHIEFPELPSTA